MNFPSRYEHFIAHFLPGTVVMLNLLVLFNKYYKFTDLHTSISTGLGIALFFVIAIFLGILIDSVIFVILNSVYPEEFLYKVNISDEQKWKYNRALGEFYYFSMFCFNSIPALLITGFTAYCINLNCKLVVFLIFISPLIAFYCGCIYWKCYKKVINN